MDEIGCASNSTYDCGYELGNERWVLLDLLVGLVRQIGDNNGDVAVRLFHGVVGVAYELVHLQPLVLPILHERQVDFLDDVGQVVQHLFHFVVFLIHMTD